MVFFKISQISLENTCSGYNENIKVWLYAFSQHISLKKDSSTQLFSSEFCRTFKKTFLLEHSSASAFIFDIFKSKKCMKVFLFTFFYEKSKTKKESRVTLNLGNPSFALQLSSSFAELRLSSC